jgi:hypothetical protein
MMPPTILLLISKSLKMMCFALAIKLCHGVKLNFKQGDYAGKPN